MAMQPLYCIRGRAGYILPEPNRGHVKACRLDIEKRMLKFCDFLLGRSWYVGYLEPRMEPRFRPGFLFGPDTVPEVGKRG